VRLAVYARADLPEHVGALRGAERAELAAMRASPARAREWIAGRAAIRRAIGAEVEIATGADGAPRVAGHDVSLAHDGAWVAVAIGRGARVGIDLCDRAHAARLARILARVGAGAAGDPCRVWAALECVLKLRRRGVWSLLDGRASVDARGLVSGIGAPVQVAWASTRDYALAWAEERA
jgi:hypothetical protein